MRRRGRQKSGVRSPVAAAWACCVFTVLVTGACRGSLVNLVEHGKYEEAVHRAAASRRIPTGKAARAHAKALIELDGWAHARSVLIWDFRHGGDVDSLRMLADLELARGLDGLAAAHFARLLEIDRKVLSGRDDLCDLFRRRAKKLAAHDEALAALRDLERVAAICDADVDSRLRETLSARGLFEAKARHTLNLTSPGQPGLDAARQSLDGQGMSENGINPTGIEGLQKTLSAEYAGHGGPYLLDKTALRAMIGDLEAETLATAMSGLKDGERAYAMLRISTVVEIPAAKSSSQTWIVSALRGLRHSADGYRIFAAIGDRTAAELAINSALRHEVALEAVQASSGPFEDEPRLPNAGTGSDPWWMRVKIDAENIRRLLALAGLFDARDLREEALRLRRHVFAEASSLSSQMQSLDVSGWKRDEVRRLLLLARPWEAAALAFGSGVLTDRVRPAAAAALILYGAPCKDDCQESERVAGVVMGEAWISEERARMLRTLRQRGYEGRRSPVSAPGCPGIRELLTSDGLGGLPEALSLAQQKIGDADVARQMVRGAESEIALVCTAAVIAPLLYEGGHQLALAMLDDRLVHAPSLDASGQLEFHAIVALAAGRVDRARLRIIAAAARSPNPLAVWKRAATAGRAFDAREFEREALRQILMHSPGLINDAAGRALVVSHLRDANIAPNLREGMEGALGSYRRAVIDHIARLPEASRWSELEGLMREVTGSVWKDERARDLVEDALWGIPGARAHHQDALAGWLAMNSQSLEPVSLTAENVAFAGGPELEIVLSHQIRRSGMSVATAAIGLAIGASERTRAGALAVLLKGAGREIDPNSEARRRDILQLLLAHPSAFSPADGKGGTNVAMVPRDLALLYIVFGLDLDPIWIAG